MGAETTTKISKAEYDARLESLRDVMKLDDVDVFLVPVTDEFQNEYTPPSSHRLKWLTGFSGSAGMAAVLADKAAVFVDGRYTLQAKAQVDEANYAHENFEGIASVAEWVAKNVAKGAKVGIDPRLTTWQEAETLRKALDKIGASLKPVSENLIDQIWLDRPAVPATDVRVQEDKVSGESSVSKRKRLGEQLVKDGVDRVVVTDQASIAWLLNVRGNDVSYTPLALSFAILNKDGSLQWYIDESRVSPAVRKHVGSGVTLCPVNALGKELSASSKTPITVQYDSKRSPLWFRDQLEKSGNTIREGDDPCLLPKACKNAVEIEGMRQAHIRDGVALTKFLIWLDEEAIKRPVTELEVADKLLEFRQAQKGFQEPSFDTIAGSGEHGAIVHYKASEETDKALAKDSIFLLDSGGQYTDGTTDVTRTIVVGEPTDEQKRRFTQVLKGHINLARAVFPEGMAGRNLDILARSALWQEGLDYAHGTGHGVGAYLGVHEGPQRIASTGDVPLKPGMVISNEPGFYKEGEFGIRIESLVVVNKSAHSKKDGKPFFEFETITMVPIDRRLIDPSIMTGEELDWLNAYHQNVHDTLAPHMNAKELAWLKERTRPLHHHDNALAADEAVHIDALEVVGSVSRPRTIGKGGR